MMHTVETRGGEVRRTGPAGDPPDGVRLTQDAGSFTMHRERPSATPLYFRIGAGRLEWSTSLAAFVPDGAVPPAPGPADLIALTHGVTAPPETTAVPGVRRLMLGGEVRLDASGITATRRHPEPPGPPADLFTAVRAVLGDLPDGYAIAYSGGLGSAYLATAALAAGHRPTLVHAELSLPRLRPAPDVPGLTVRRVPVDLATLFDHHPITGAEPLPVLPETEARRRLSAALADAVDGPLAGGGLLRDLTAVKLPDIDPGPRAWRLLGCEPFHIAGTLRSLAHAREMVGERIVFRPGDTGGAPAEPDVQRVGAPPPPSPTGGSRLPWLTPEGKRVLELAHRGGMAVWQDHLDTLDPVTGRLVAGLEERGDGGTHSPALDPRVFTAAAAIPVARLGRVRRGVFENHRPLRDRTARITGLRGASTGYWLRAGATAHLAREREKIALELQRGCALADLGLVDVSAVVRNLRDGRDIAEHALPLLRLVWLDRWLRGRP
jgi:hypothetical protein